MVTTEHETDDARALTALAADAALLDPLDRELVIARGADRVRFLNGVVTADIAHLPVGAGTRALLLTPKAHILADMQLFLREEDAYLVVAAGQGQATAAALSRYAVMDDFTAEVAPEVQLIAVLGPRAADALAAAELSTVAFDGAPPWSHATLGPRCVARVRQLGAEGYWVAGPRSEIDGVREALRARGTPRLSPAVAEVARIAAREPGWGQEITDEFFPMEIGLGDAISYGKGCFLGQEPIVRIRDRGHLNWRLAALELPGDAAGVAVGDRLESDSKPKAGKVTSVARAPDGRPVALAVVHVSVPAGGVVRILRPATGPSEAAAGPSEAAAGPSVTAIVR
jgi:folate-binding protein YgfZ